MAEAGTLWTVGHSTRGWEAFVALLHEAGIEALADVRRFAGSRRHPQFAATAMARALPAAGIAYLPMPELGGRRPPRPDSPNTAWRNKSCKGRWPSEATTRCVSRAAGRGKRPRDA